jgi:hypothetical protein
VGFGGASCEAGAGRAALGAPLAEESKPTDDEAMSSSREVAASSLRIVVVSELPSTGTSTGRRGFCRSNCMTTMFPRRGLSPF